MRFSTDTPTLAEWIALIQQDSAQAKKHMISLKARNKLQGIMAEPALEISVEDYDRAQRLLAAQDTATSEKVARLARLGHARLRPYREQVDWLELIGREPVFAREVYDALRARQAMLGLSAPQPLLDSIAAYRAASTGMRS